MSFNSNELMTLTHHSKIKKIPCFLFILIFISHESAAEFAIRSKKIAGTNFLCLSDVAAYFGMDIRGKQKNYSVYSDESNINITLGSRKFSINSIVAYFAKAPQRNQNIILISELDMTRFIDPILRSKALPRHTINRIVIDPGHGGKDKGGVGRNYLEKNINLTISKYLAAMLREKGYTVLLTRDNDAYISLRRRGDITREFGGDLFISIHCNVVTRSSVTGVESYIVTPKGMPSTGKTRIQSKRVSGNNFGKLNARFAFELHKRILSVSDTKDRGIKYNRFQVLREASCPAILVETGFLSNKAEEKKLASSSYQKKIAISLANGVIAFHNALNNN